jgi:hypothetical protein
MTDNDSTRLRYCHTSDRYWEHNAEVLSNKWQILTEQWWGTVKQVTDINSTVLRYCHTSDRYWQHSAEVLSNEWEILTEEWWGTIKWVTDTDSTVLRYCQMNDRYWEHSAEVLSIHSFSLYLHSIDPILVTTPVDIDITNRLVWPAVQFDR